MRDIQKKVMEFVDPDMVFFIYYGDEPAAFCVIFLTLTHCSSVSTGDRSDGFAEVPHVSAGDQRIALLMFGIKDKFRQLGLPC